MTSPTYRANTANPRGTYRDVNEQGSAMPITWQTKPCRVRQAEKQRAKTLAAGKRPRKFKGGILATEANR